MSHQAPATSQRAVRFTFRVNDLKINLMDVERLSMAVLPSDNFEENVPRSGSWFEAQDSEGRSIYRRALARPFGPFIEVRSDDPDGPLVYQAGRPAERLLSVVVPDVPSGGVLVFLSSQPDAADAVAKERPEALRHYRALKAREIARFPIEPRGGAHD